MAHSRVEQVARMTQDKGGMKKVCWELKKLVYKGAEGFDAFSEEKQGWILENVPPYLEEFAEDQLEYKSESSFFIQMIVRYCLSKGWSKVSPKESLKKHFWKCISSMCRFDRKGDYNIWMPPALTIRSNSEVQDILNRMVADIADEVLCTVLKIYKYNSPPIIVFYGEQQRGLGKYHIALFEWMIQRKIMTADGVSVLISRAEKDVGMTVLERLSFQHLSNLFSTISDSVNYTDMKSRLAL